MMTDALNNPSPWDQNRPPRRIVMISVLVVAAVWAGLYLPGLGVIELKGEESTRIWPAMHMLDHGQWALPHIADAPYFNKPPLINWCIAASFAITGERTEATARVVGSLFVLIFALHVLLTRCAWLTAKGRFITAMVFMTCISIIEKGRLAEIEGPYVCLTGMAVLWWLSGWSRNRAGWSMWLGAGVLLGLGMITKPPMHLVVFYVTVISVLAYERRLKDLLSLRHLACVLLMVGITGGWVAMAFEQATAAERELMTSTWFSETAKRASRPKQGSFALLWLRNSFGSGGRLLIYFLPWTIFLIALWKRSIMERIRSTDHWRTFKGARLALLVATVAMVSLIPGARARYATPVFPLAALLVGWTLSQYRLKWYEDLLWRHVLMTLLIAATAVAAAATIVMECWLWGSVLTAFSLAATLAAGPKLYTFQGTMRQSVVQAVLMIIVVGHLAVFGPKLTPSFERRRPAAAQVDQTEPPGKPIYFKRGEHPSFLFYVAHEIHYVDLGTLPEHGAEYLIVSGVVQEEMRRAGQFKALRPRMLASLKKSSSRDYRLLELIPRQKRN